MTKPPDAFLSYTRFDDRREHGKISQFRQELADEVQAVTAEPFEIFQDVDGIGLGEHWPDKLNEMLDQARFFVPILTPLYFKSKPCRGELEKFAQLERKAGRDDLILPIYWRTCPVLEDKELCAANPLATLIDSRHRLDWRDLRHHSFRTRKVKLELEALANQINDARRRITLISIDEFKARLRIADIVGRYVKLTPRGREYLGLCPFHQEKMPSFTVSEAKGFYHCFGCGQHGNAIDFVMAIEGFNFDQAVAHLATLLGVRPPRPGGPRRPTASVQGAERHQPGTAFRDIDAPWCPELVVIPPGEFMMGSTEAEREWAVAQGAERQWVDREKPQHLVRIGYPLAVGRYPVTFEQYDHFCGKTGRDRPEDRRLGPGPATGDQRVLG